jgi:hypothetical protein
MLRATIIEKEVNFEPKNAFISAIYSNFSKTGSGMDRCLSAVLSDQVYRLIHAWPGGPGDGNQKPGSCENPAPS